MPKYAQLLCIIVSLFCCISCNDNKKETSKLTLKNSQDIALKNSIEKGGLLYTDFCMQCHLANGAGVPNNFPPLAQSNWLTEKRTESIHAVKYGQQGKIIVNGKTYNGYMAPMGLSNEEVADVMNYIMNSWGNTQDRMVTPEEVEAVKK